MARIEDFLNEARTEALELLVDISERDDAAAFAGPPLNLEGLGQGSRAVVMKRGHWEDSIRLGVSPAFRGVRAALTATTQGRPESKDPFPQALRRLATHDAVSRRGVVPDPRLERVGACFTAVADLVRDMPAEEKRRVHDHVATTAAHVARACAAAQTRPGALHERSRERLTVVARDLDARRTTAAPHELGERGLVGVPETPLEQALSRWHAHSADALGGERLAAGAASAPDVAGVAAQVSAAAYRACLAQDDPAAHERAEHWKGQALAWRDARDAWRPPPVLVSGDHRPQPELTAVGRDLRERLGSEFRATDGRWVPPERLADPEALRRFEYDARRVMSDLGERYHSAVGSLAKSEVIAIPVAQQSGLDDVALEAMRGPNGRRDWVVLPATDEAAKRLTNTAAQVEAAAGKLNALPRDETRGDQISRAVAPAFPNRGATPTVAAAAPRPRTEPQGRSGPTLER